MSVGERVGEGAFGWPGLAPRWARGAKQGVGTAATAQSRVWFTIAEGILTEVYWPRVDRPQSRDLQFLISDGQSFVHEERRDLFHRVRFLDDRSLAYRITSRDPAGRYHLEKQILTDPDADALVLRTWLRLRKDAGPLHLYALWAPRMGGQGAGNTAQVVHRDGQTLLIAHRGDEWAVLAANVPISAASAGFVGFSDGWTDLHQDFRLDWSFSEARGGNVALIAQLEVMAGRAFQVALGFGTNEETAIGTTLTTLAKPFRDVAQQYVAGWRAYLESLPELESLARCSGDGGWLTRTSALVLKAHADKLHTGAIVAALVVPWGDAAGDENPGYHLIWPRDLVHAALGLLAVGDRALAAEVLRFLARTQRADGSWPQNFWLDGTPFWTGLQLDEVAFPIILAWRLWTDGGLDWDPYPSLVRPAALFLARTGPVTPQERWEENPGYSPATLAVAIAALVLAADLATVANDEAVARYLLEVADYWAANVETWTYTHCGALLPGHPAHYERVAARPAGEFGPEGAECRIAIPLANHLEDPHVSQCCVVDASFLELVRYGVRSPDDPHVLATLPVVDALLRVDLPSGPAWRRYNQDGYGEPWDGSPYTGIGVGHPWPLLTGERGHYVLARGRSPRSYLQTLERLAGPERLLPEQVWDGPDLPSRRLRHGGPTGSARPLVWAHAEYLRLLRSERDRQVFDRPAPVMARYRAGARSDLAIWKFNHKLRTVSCHLRLRIEVGARAELRWSNDGWRTVIQEPLAEIAPGVWVRDFPLGTLPSSSELVFTFFWTDAGRWEGRDFAIAVVSEADR